MTRNLDVNPLATRYVAPGQLPWIGSGETDLEHLVQKFYQLGRSCQIIGPHGSGKSTLLEHLVPRFAGKVIRLDVNGEKVSDVRTAKQDSQPTVWWFALRRGSPVMAKFNSFWKQKEFGGLIVLDGGEQLSWWRRWRLGRWARRRQCGLLVTSHTGLGLGTLLHTRVAPKLATEVVRQAYLKACGEAVVPRKVEEIDWESWLDRHQGNLRECLMELYDHVEVLMREAK